MSVSSTTIPASSSLVLSFVSGAPHSGPEVVVSRQGTCLLFHIRRADLVHERYLLPILAPHQLKSPYRLSALYHILHPLSCLYRRQPRRIHPTIPRNAQPPHFCLVIRLVTRHHTAAVAPSHSTALPLQSNSESLYHLVPFFRLDLSRTSLCLLQSMPARIQNTDGSTPGGLIPKYTSIFVISCTLTIPPCNVQYMAPSQR